MVGQGPVEVNVITLEKTAVTAASDSSSQRGSHRNRRIAVLSLELLGMACMLYAILELARYVIVYHQEHPDFYLTWGLYLELTGLAVGLVYWGIVFRRTLVRFADTLDKRDTARR